MEKILSLPSVDWTAAIIDTPKRTHQQIQYVEDTVNMTNYTGGCRQVAARGMVRESPTLF